MNDAVKQGFILASILFSLAFYPMLIDVYRNERPGIRFAYRRDSQLLNQQRMDFQSRGSITTVHELLFADDCAHNATSEGDMKRSMDLFDAACDDFGLIMNTEKTGVMHHRYPTLPTIQPKST
nr:unnamed protein product [Spirometra erinaceieuropaei]